VSFEYPPIPSPRGYYIFMIIPGLTIYHRYMHDGTNIETPDRTYELLAISVKGVTFWVIVG